MRGSFGQPLEFDSLPQQSQDKLPLVYLKPSEVAKRKEDKFWKTGMPGNIEKNVYRLKNLKRKS